MGLILKDILIKKDKAYIRSYMRGYQILKKQNNLGFLNEVKCFLTEKTIQKNRIKFSFEEKENICLTQFMLTRILDYDFNKALLSAISSPNREIKFHLPKNWRLLLESKGFKANTKSNYLRWIFFTYKWYIIGILSGLVEFSRFFFSKFKAKKNFAYFHNLTLNNLPYEDSKTSDRTIIGWYIKKFKSNEKEIYHTVKGVSNYKYKERRIIFTDSPIPSLDEFKSLCKFSFWFFLNTIFSIFFIRRRLLFRERVLQNVYTYYNSNFKPKYFFHNTGPILRPLWTYDAEIKGADIIFYFYSLNYQEIQEKGKSEVKNYFWQSVSWPEYWIWNNYQLGYLKSKIQYPSKFINVGPIPFSTGRKPKFFKITKKSIIVFDIQPKRDYFYQFLGVNFEFYDTNFSIRFLESINSIAKKFNLNVIIKRKRESLKNLDSKKYFNFYKKLIKSENWIELDPNLDVYSVSKSKNIVASIATPFTSAVHFTKKNKIPTIYFDPTNKMIENQTAAQQFELIGSEKKLFHWMEKELNK